MSLASTEEERCNTARAIQLAAVAALGGFMFGFDTAVINGAVTAVREDFAMSSGLTGFVVASALLGAALGAWGAGRLGDRYGRIRVMVAAAVLFIVSAIGSGLATGPVSLTLWRVVGGLGVGAASVIAPAYIAEISPASIRGRLGSLQQLAIVVGIFLALLVDAMLARIAGGAGEDLALGLEAWRWMFISEALPGLIYGALSLTIPESPRYLVQKRQKARAHTVLAQVLESGVDERIAEIERSVAAQERSDASFADLRGPALGLKPIVWVGILLSVFQQAVGINVIFYYSSALWQQVGFSEADALTITVITSVTSSSRSSPSGPSTASAGASCCSSARPACRSASARSRPSSPPPASRAASRSWATPPAWSRSSRPTCSSSSSASAGARSCGCCSGRCSATASAPSPSASPPPRSGSATS